MNDAPFILICDDSEKIAECIALHLETAGYRTQVVGGALEAVSAARRRRPSLVLMDVMMPGLDGGLAAGMMHDEPELAGIPVVLVSGMPEEDIREAAEGAGAAGWLAKPFRREDLLACVARHLRAPDADRSAAG